MNTLIWHIVIIATQAKPHVPVDRVLNLHNGRDVAAGPTALSNVAALYTGKKYSQESYGFTSHSQRLFRKYQCATSIVLCADNPFSFYFSIQKELYPCRQAGWQFERRPHFVANSLSIRRMTHSPGSFSSHNDGSDKDLRTFTTTLLVHLGPLSGSSPNDYMTNIDQSLLDCSHTFNDQSSTPHSPTRY